MRYVRTDTYKIYDDLRCTRAVLLNIDSYWLCANISITVTSIWCCSVHAAVVTSCERRAGPTRTCPVRSKRKAARTEVLLIIPPGPFFWPSSQAMRHETDGGQNNATRYRRSRSDSRKSRLHHCTYPAAGAFTLSPATKLIRQSVGRSSIKRI